MFLHYRRSLSDHRTRKPRVWSVVAGLSGLAALSRTHQSYLVQLADEDAEVRDQLSSTAAADRRHNKWRPLDLVTVPFQLVTSFGPPSVVIAADL